MLIPHLMGLSNQSPHGHAAVGSNQNFTSVWLGKNFTEFLRTFFDAESLKNSGTQGRAIKMNNVIFIN